MIVTSMAVLSIQLRGQRDTFADRASSDFVNVLFSGNLYKGKSSHKAKI